MIKERVFMTYVFEKDTSNGLMEVEYTISSVTNKPAVIEMTINGKFHRVNWMSHEGRAWLMDLLTKDYEEVVNCTSVNNYV
tara:strand:- start:973 stop:1215 length:243 start_codon:yes stop_codon:yes gene_type:complete